MIVKMLTTYANHEQTCRAGQLISVSEEEGRMLIEKKYATATTKHTKPDVKVEEKPTNDPAAARKKKQQEAKNALTSEEA